MNLKTSSFLLLIFLSLGLLLCSSATELDLCVKECHGDNEGFLECTTRCQQQDLSQSNPEDPRRLYEQCQRRCERQPPRTQKECKRECKREFERRQKGGEHDNVIVNPEERGEPRSSENPYHFHSGSFKERMRTSQGFIKVLPKFTKRSWRLFRGLENYRVGFLEVKPHTFYIPHHCDSHAVFVVVRGRGTISFVSQKTKESFNIERGNVVRIPAGATLYMTNTDENEPFQLAKFVVAFNIPGKFEEFFLAGAANQQSYFDGFSDEVLEAVFNAPREELEKVFGQPQLQQKREVFRKVSPEHVKALSRHASSVSKKRQGKRRWTPFDLQNERVFSNNFGQFYEAKPHEYKQLEDIDVSVAWVNMTKGSIFAPHYNSKTTFFVFVVEGNGRFEMACPHISSEEWQQRGRREHEYEQEQEHTGQVHKIRSEVSQGDVFIVPSGHPVALIANDNLVAVGFGVNAGHNKRNFLAGQENIVNNMETVEKQLTFEAEADVVEKVFKSQEESYFMPARRSRYQKRGGGEGKMPSFQSIFDFAGY